MKIEISEASDSIQGPKVKLMPRSSRGTSFMDLQLQNHDEVKETGGHGMQYRRSIRRQPRAHSKASTEEGQ